MDLKIKLLRKNLIMFKLDDLKSKCIELSRKCKSQCIKIQS